MREIVLTGSVPLRPATKVFEALARHLGTAAPFYPDGEQVGWVGGTLGLLKKNPNLEELYSLKLSDEIEISNTFYRLKGGTKAKELKLGPFLLADNAIASYAAFKALKEKGVIPPGTRFEVTIPAAGMLAGHIHMLPQESYPLAAAALGGEIARILEAIPASEMLIQFDVPLETSHVEYERRPWAFNVPYFDSIRSRFEDAVAALAMLASQVTSDIPIGIHTCSAWHLNPSADQDNWTLIDISNQYLRAIRRPVRYIHIPIHPSHNKVAHYTPFRELELPPETSLSLGIINMVDKLEGAKRRMDAAEKAGLYDFGVAFWCGLGFGRKICLHPYAEQPTEQTIAEVLDLHKQVARL